VGNALTSELKGEAEGEEEGETAAGEETSLDVDVELTETTSFE
jgi:hypothetical protein